MAWKFFVEKNIVQQTLEIRALRELVVPSGYSIAWAKPLEIEEADEGIFVDPFMSMPEDEVRGFLQGLTDAAWDIGIRPSNMATDNEMIAAQAKIIESLNKQLKMSNDLAIKMSDVVIGYTKLGAEDENTE